MPLGPIDKAKGLLKATGSFLQFGRIRRVVHEESCFGPRGEAEPVAKVEQDQRVNVPLQLKDKRLNVFGV